MLRVCEKLREADAKGRRYGLARAETGYLRALVDAVADKDRLAEVELLKSLGDVNLEKGRLEKDVGRFNMALALYVAAMVRCGYRDQGDGIEHRYEYAERLLQGVTSKGSQGQEQQTEDKETTTPAKVALKFQNLDKKRAAGGNTDSMLVGYAQLIVEGIVNENNMLETEAIKSLGDVYLKRGTETGDNRDLTKATALYNTALARCNNVQGTVVILHRLQFTAKIRQDIAAKSKKKSTRTQRQQDVQKRKDHISTFSTATSSDNTNDRMRRPHSVYEEHLQDGCKALQTGDLDKAEQSFAAALKSVHIQGEHMEEVETLYMLGKVYLKRGIQSKDGGDFTKAAALCNAALVRSSREDIEEAIKEITHAFVKEVLKIEQKVDSDDTEKHKLILKAERDYVQKEITRIEQEVDPYSLDDEDPKIKDVEMKRVEAIKALCQTIVHQRKVFIAGLVDECMGVMDPLPCKYAMIGLGSQATGLVTPYSDLEFALLVDKETEENVTYFRNLTHYLHLKVINLGETILPAMAIKSLNDFYSDDPLDSWFYDSVTPRGFAFDGAMPHACKTPLGRGRNSRGTSELIRTPSNMTNVLKEDLTLHLKKGYHLASILGNVSFITGEQGLVDEYRSLWAQQLQNNNGRVPLVMAINLLGENVSNFQTQALTAELRNVKTEIYRFSSLAVSFLALLHNIQPTTIWETIQELRNSGVIDSENSHHLMVLVSISAELRLRTYMSNRGQVENMSVLWSMSTNTGIEEKLQKVFYISSPKQLMRYYYTERPLKHFISQLTDAHSLKEPPIFFDNSSELKAEVYKSLCDFENLKKCTEQTLHNYLSKYGENTAHRDVAASLDDLAFALMTLGDHKKAVRYLEQALQMRWSMYDEGTAHPDIADSLRNLGEAWSFLGDHEKALCYFEQSLQMRRSIYGEETAHPDIFESLNNMGIAWFNLGDYTKAVSYYKQSLQITRRIYGEDIAHPDIAILLNNMGNACSDLGDYGKAISYYEQSLQMRRSIYGEDTAHPEIAYSLNNMGNAWSNLGDHRKAISYHEQSLQMRRSIYGEDTAHPNIAASLNNLGAIWSSLGDHRKAISYYEQALQMKLSIYGEDTAHADIASSLNNLEMNRSIYGEDTAHPDIAASLNNLGNAWSNLGDHRKAISYYEQALQMNRSIYGEDTAHSDIAASLNNLGNAWSNLGDHRKAISYYEQALQMNRSIYGEDTAHPDIATSLNNMGNAWSNLGDHRKAISYYEQALQMNRSIYGEDTAHPDIATSLNNMGNTWGDLGDHRKAISYYEQSLQMMRTIYGYSPPVRRDRASGAGGVLIAVRDCYTAVEVEQPSEIKAEISWIKVSLRNKKSLYLGSYYRTPSGKHSEQLDELEKSIKHIRNLTKNNPGSTIILGGDFNLGDVDWETESIPKNSRERVPGERLISIFNNNRVSQMQREPTRFGRLLDLFVTSKPSLVKTMSTLPGIAYDHDVIVADCDIIPAYTKKAPRKIYIFSKANWDNIRELFGAFARELTTNINQHTVEDNWSALKNKIHDLISSHATDGFIIVDLWGAHTSGYNDVAIGINFLGYFEDDLPTSAALETGKNLIACGVTMGKIKSGYDLNCHSDLGASSGGTDCPRAALCLYATERLRPSVKLINSSWPHVQLLHVKRILRF
uniref:Peptidoglycan recognition protein family domain-containing protein n=1 Tax=Branchiostoma floridae TaxID=7739 RepID=C3YN84_BRAFL|eukprot:XP_002602178.1 hypothetical protein BRAFLDRAFT_76866 [Branchiostoma floridae]